MLKPLIKEKLLGKLDVFMFLKHFFELLVGILNVFEILYDLRYDGSIGQG